MNIDDMVISECEEMIMKVIWSNPDEDLDLITLNEKVAERYGRAWKLQTTATFMSRLQKKGWIDIYKIKRYSHYHAKVTKEAYEELKMRELIDLFWGEERETVMGRVVGLARAELFPEGIEAEEKTE